MSGAVTEFAVTARPRLAETLAAFGQADDTGSIAVVGLPGFGADELLRHLEGLCSENGTRVKRFRLEELRLTDGPARVLDGLLSAFAPDSPGIGGSFEDKLLALRELGIRDAQAHGDLPILSFEGLHEITRLGSEKHAQVQAILDCLQAAATEAPRWARIWSSSHIEPARACESIGWSSFYKVFGPRVYYVGPLASADARIAMLSLLDSHSDLTYCKAAVDEALESLPLIPRVLAGAVVHIETSCQFGADGLSACLLQYAELYGRWQQLLEGDLAVLVTLHSAQSLPVGPALTSARRLQRFGLVVEDAGRFVAADNLTGIVPTAQKAVASDGYVRGMWHVPSAARPLIQRVLSEQGLQYAELQVIQHREGEALVLRVAREDSGGTRLRPWILKVDSRPSIEREAELTEVARNLLGPAVPEVLSVSSEGGTGCLLIDFACADSRSYSVWTLEDLMLRDETAGAEMLNRLLSSVLGALYSDTRSKRVKLRGFYHIPRLEELDRLVELGKGSQHAFMDTACLSNAMDAVFAQARDTVMCSKVHGDLNARNVLIDGAQNVHAIDFSTFKEGPLAKDFARLETEILFRVFDRWNDEMAWALAHLLTQSDLLGSARLVCALSESPSMAGVAKCIYSLRANCLEFWTNSDAVSVESFRADYLAALAASSLRTALFHDYTSDMQRRASAAYGFAALRGAAV